MTLEKMKSLPEDEQNKLFKRLDIIRQKGKSTNYSCTYGAKASTVARTAGIPEKEAQKLVEAYWKRNWSIAEIPKSLTRKYLSDGSCWQLNPISHFWYSLRTEKDSFSTLNQGTGTYLFDMWVKNVRSKGRKVIGQFHDELITITNLTDQEACKNDLKCAIQEVNEEFKLNRDLDIDVQFGHSYADIH